MAKYDLREGPCATAYLYTALQTVGPETRGSIIVPADCHSIKEIWGSYHISTGTDIKGAVVAVKLQGAGVAGVGVYETLLGGYTNGTKTTSGGQVQEFKSLVIKTNLAVNPGQELWIYGNQVTTAVAGTVEVQVGLVFDTGQGDKRFSFIRFNDCGTLDTKTGLTLDAEGNTKGNIVVQAGMNHIVSMIPALGGIALATATGGTAFARLEGGLIDGNMQFAVGGSAALITTTGFGAGYFLTEQIVTDITLAPGGQVSVFGVQSGVDWGTPCIGVAFEVM